MLECRTDKGIPLTEMLAGCLTSFYTRPAREEMHLIAVMHGKGGWTQASYFLLRPGSESQFVDWREAVMPQDSSGHVVVVGSLAELDIELQRVRAAINDQQTLGSLLESILAGYLPTLGEVH